MIADYDEQTDLTTVPWKSCRICKQSNEQFKSPKEFSSHLKMVHCRREGGSYICTYGPNLLCKNLPLEGVCGKDYDTHISRYHVAPRTETSKNVYMKNQQQQESQNQLFSASLDQNHVSAVQVSDDNINGLGSKEASISAKTGEFIY